MKISAIPLINVDNVNSYIQSQQLEYTAGDVATFYFQLVDLDKNKAQCGFNPPGLRYIPLATTTPTVAVTFLNIDDAKQFTRFATNPFPQDLSIWAVSLLATDPVSGTVHLKFVLTENVGTTEAPVNTTKTFSVKAAISAGV